MSTSSLRRPVSVTIIAVLMVIGAAVELAAGIWMLVAAGRAEPFANTAIEDWSDTQLSTSAVGYFVLAAVQLLLAFGILRGNRVARIVVTVVAVVAIVGGVFSWPVGIAPVLVNVAILVMLWHRTADDWFRARA